MPYCWSDGGGVVDGCAQDQELVGGAEVGRALCHWVAGPGNCGPAGAADIMGGGAPGIGGALIDGGYAAPCGGVAQLPYWAGCPIMPVAGGATVAAVFGVWQPAAVRTVSSPNSVIARVPGSRSGSRWRVEADTAVAPREDGFGRVR